MQLAKVSFNHPSVVLTADVFHFFIKYLSIAWYRGKSSGVYDTWYLSTRVFAGGLEAAGRRLAHAQNVTSDGVSTTEKNITVRKIDTDTAGIAINRAS